MVGMMPFSSASPSPGFASDARPDPLRAGSNKARILVVEDEPSLRADLVDFLSARGYVAEGLDRAEALLPALARGPADLLVLDVNLPDGDGFQLARSIRPRFPGGIVMLTCRSTADDRVEGLDSGADAYLVKQASLREIEATIRSVLRRLGAAPTDAEAWLFNPLKWQLTSPEGKTVTLTGNETAFVGALVEKAGKPCNRDEIARALARPAMRGEDRSIDALVRRLRRKIEEEVGGEAPIRMIYGIGYSFSAAVVIRDTAA